MARMTDDAIRATVDARVGKTLSTSDSELRMDRERALNAYFGRPMGNEIEGRAQVVSKDIMDTIEWMMPSLCRVFATSDAVKFDPVGPEDEKQAKQETAYVSHVFWKKNPGFMIVYNSLKDGLMQKLGYVKYYWDKSEKVSFETYEGLSDEQLVTTMEKLQQKGKVDVIGQEQAEDGSWSVKLRLTKKYGCLKVETIPPDEIIVDSECRGSIKNAKLAGHIRKVTRSDLMEMGYSRAKVGSLSSYTCGTSSEALTRDTVNESTSAMNDKDEAEWASGELTLLECYTTIDVDGDGIAEMRKLLLPGEGVLENDEWDEIPFESFTPTPVPHRHVGLSIYDLMEELWRIKTALQRGLLDNVYFTMNPRSVYDKNTIDVSTLQVNRPGGHVANDGPPGMAIMPMPVAPMAGQLLPVIDYFDQVRETRTGVGRMTSGVDANVLAQSTKGAYTDAKSAANQRIEMVARIYAETFMAGLWQSMHKLLSRHQQKEVQFQVRKEWITTNPVEWMERESMTVTVGLGNANREEVKGNLVFMGTAQQQAAAVPGLIQPQNVYELFTRMQEEMGFDGANFITNPDSGEYKQFLANQPKQQDPYLQAEQLKAQTNQQKSQTDAAVKIRGQNMEQATEIAKLEVGANMDLAQIGIGAELDARAAQESLGNGSTIT